MNVGLEYLSISVTTDESINQLFEFNVSVCYKFKLNWGIPPFLLSKEKGGWMLRIEMKGFPD